jgi:3-isopropylmalate/(R)-2-methylmalate dehydratase small subunit
MASELFVVSHGAPLMRDNINTDEIIPGPEMVRSNDDAFERWGQGLFAAWRYRAERIENPEFILNQAPWRTAAILIAGENFGCGSSREAAARAIRGFGFRAVIAPSFAGIFFNNCLRNGVAPIVLPKEEVERLAAEALALRAGQRLALDLQGRIVTTQDGRCLRFELSDRGVLMLTTAMDEIALTLVDRGALDVFWAADRQRRPWIYSSDT